MSSPPLADLGRQLHHLLELSRALVDSAQAATAEATRTSVADLVSEWNAYRHQYAEEEERGRTAEWAGERAPALPAYEPPYWARWRGYQKLSQRLYQRMRGTYAVINGLRFPEVSSLARSLVDACQPLTEYWPVRWDNRGAPTEANWCELAEVGRDGLRRALNAVTHTQESLREAEEMCCSCPEGNAADRRLPLAFHLGGSNQPGSVEVATVTTAQAPQPLEQEHKEGVYGNGGNSGPVAVAPGGEGPRAAAGPVAVAGGTANPRPPTDLPSNGAKDGPSDPDPEIELPVFRWKGVFDKGDTEVRKKLKDLCSRKLATGGRGTGANGYRVKLSALSDTERGRLARQLEKHHAEAEGKARPRSRKKQKKPDTSQ